ncbi:hypothetical protein [Streptomyces sp. NPDC096132]|uniref:hypothetical protein n=1 Tax=Streptomyces sp. NPDC096132 TaxID=3366075 RepID=UPI0037FD1148
MSRAGRGRRTGARLAAGAALAGCALLTVPQPASACAVGIGYKPSVSIDDLTHRRTCSTGTSAVGVAGFTTLALGALAAAGLVVFRRGERETSGNPSALTAYLDATGVLPPSPPQERGDAT